MKPGIKSIIVGGVLALVGLVGAFGIPLLVILPSLLGESNQVQFKAPGTIKVSVEQPGRWYLWNDFRTVYEGKNYNRSEGIPDGMEIRVYNSKGELLEFVADTSLSSEGGGSWKNSIGYVEVESPAELRIEVSGGNEERILSFSQSGLLKMFGLILGGELLSSLVAISGIGLVVWGIVKLVKTNRKHARCTAPNGGPAAPMNNSRVTEGSPSVS